MQLTKTIFLGGLLAISQATFAHGPITVPLIGVPTPPVPGLTDGADPIIVNEDMAIALGKALFWDMNVGSDGVACASCHFHAGADRRVTNQINPGILSPHPSGQTFDNLPSGSGGPNYTLNVADFPTHQFSNPLDMTSSVLHTTDDSIASSGTFGGDFTGASPFTGINDDCVRSADPTFNVNGIGTRRVEPRNAPTVINAVFNHRSFWDGRGNNVFNGSNNMGDRDTAAGPWVLVNRRRVAKQPLHLINSALASQAVATALSQLEMTCGNRSIADIGRKLLMRQPLQYQKVHTADSVFSPLNLNKPLSATGDLQAGLNTTYKTMIRAAFAKKYWSYTRRGAFGAPASGGNAYNQMEANFPMFFGLAIQMYESTLVSDQAPVDTTLRNPTTYKPEIGGGMSEAAIRGSLEFSNNHCNLCHAGPTLTTNAIATNSALVTPTPGQFYGPNHSLRALGPNAMGLVGFDGADDAFITPEANVLFRSKTNHELENRIMDFGFFNTGVGDPTSDQGLAAMDDLDNPLSFSAQYIDYLMGNTAGVKDDPVNHVYSCQFESPLSWNIPVPFGDTFNSAADTLEQDGSREGLLRNVNCRNNGWAYIPTPASAQAAAGSLKLATATQAAFKTPLLRNIELTGPYMHNGSMSTLEQVIEFYARGGNFDNVQIHHLMSSTLGINSDPQKRADLVEFLKSLTDERVRYEQAPFDHPELIVPNGHQGDEAFVTAGNPLDPALAKENFINIPAVGAGGSATPLLPFDQYLAP